LVPGGSQWFVSRGATEEREVEQGEVEEEEEREREWWGA
jgi:hypothetical protein